MTMPCIPYFFIMDNAQHPVCLHSGYCPVPHISAWVEYELTHSSSWSSRRDDRISWCPVTHSVPSSGSMKGLLKVTLLTIGVLMNSANSISLLMCLSGTILPQDISFTYYPQKKHLCYFILHALYVLYITSTIGTLYYMHYRHFILHAL